MEWHVGLCRNGPVSGVIKRFLLEPPPTAATHITHLSFGSICVKGRGESKSEVSDIIIKKLDCIQIVVGVVDVDRRPKMRRAH